MNLFKKRTATSQKTESSKQSQKTWADSQHYELEHAYIFMKDPSFVELAGKFKRGELQSKTGYTNELILKEFFGNSKSEYEEFLNFIQNKNCLDIGPCVFSPVSIWDGTASKHIIEPLYKPISKWQQEHLGVNMFEGLTCFDSPAEVLIPELVGKIDGVLYCRNMIDHSPNWPFILTNMSAYAAKGCKVLFWCDTDHKGTADDGHYDITPDVEMFKRLFTQLGFKVLREYQDLNRHETNWGCFAERV